jgi:hypothetical protein
MPSTKKILIGAIKITYSYELANNQRQGVCDLIELRGSSMKSPLQICDEDLKGSPHAESS